MQHQTMIYADRFCGLCHTEYDEVKYTPPLVEGLPAVATVRCINPNCQDGRNHYVNVSPELPREEPANVHR